MLPIFVVMSVVLLGRRRTRLGRRLVVDERAARAARRGRGRPRGCHLPAGQRSDGVPSARDETTKNGYTERRAEGVPVTPRRDLRDPRKLHRGHRLALSIRTSPRLLLERWSLPSQIAVAVTGAADLVLPVPMGSPQNYYGVGYFMDAVARDPVDHLGVVSVRSPTNATSATGASRTMRSGVARRQKARTTTRRAGMASTSAPSPTGHDHWHPRAA